MPRRVEAYEVGCHPRHGDVVDEGSDVLQDVAATTAPVPLLCCGRFFIDRHEPLDRIIALDGQVNTNHRNAIAVLIPIVTNGHRNGCDQRAFRKAAMRGKPGSQACATRGQHDIVHGRSEGTLDRLHIVERNVRERDGAVGREGAVERSWRRLEQGRLLRNLAVCGRRGLGLPFGSDRRSHFSPLLRRRVEACPRGFGAYRPRARGAWARDREPRARPGEGSLRPSGLVSRSVLAIAALWPPSIAAWWIFMTSASCRPRDPLRPRPSTRACRARDIGLRTRRQSRRTRACRPETEASCVRGVCRGRKPGPRSSGGRRFAMAPERCGAGTAG